MYQVPGVNLRRQGGAPPWAHAEAERVVAANGLGRETIIGVWVVSDANRKAMSSQLACSPCSLGVGTLLCPLLAIYTVPFCLFCSACQTTCRKDSQDGVMESTVYVLTDTQLHISLQDKSCWPKQEEIAGWCGPAWLNRGSVPLSEIREVVAGGPVSCLCVEYENAPHANLCNANFGEPGEVAFVNIGATCYPTEWVKVKVDEGHSVAVYGGFRTKRSYKGDDWFPMYVGNAESVVRIIKSARQQAMSPNVNVPAALPVPAQSYAPAAPEMHRGINPSGQSYVTPTAPLPMVMAQVIETGQAPPPRIAASEVAPLPRPTAPAGEGKAEEMDQMHKMRQLKQLLDEGILTQGEYDEKKAQLLSKMGL